MRAAKQSLVWAGWRADLTDFLMEKDLPTSELKDNFMIMKLNLDPENTCDRPEDGEEEDYAADYEEEYSNVDSALDEIASFLDKLEKKNERLFSELNDLLKDNQQTRKEMEEERLKNDEKETN